MALRIINRSPLASSFLLSLLFCFLLLLSYGESFQNDGYHYAVNPLVFLDRQQRRMSSCCSQNHHHHLGTRPPYSTLGIIKTTTTTTTTTTALLAKKQHGDASSSSSSAEYTLIHSHHLLDHKPDNMIVKGGKFKLRGVACLGRPGVALCSGPQAAIDKFLKKLKSAMPQKKFATISITATTTTTPDDDTSSMTKMMDGFEEVSLGELRTVLATLGHEDQFFAITGIDPSIAVSTNNNTSDDISDSSSSGGKTKAGKKKKKKK